MIKNLKCLRSFIVLLRYVWSQFNVKRSSSGPGAMRKKIIIISFLICKYLTTKRYNHLLYEYIIWLINPILLGDALSWYILIIRDFGPALCRSVNFDLFLMLFITDNLGGGIHSSYLVAWGISSVLFHFLPPVETPRNIAISFEIILYASSNLIDYITKSVKSSNSGRPKREECNDCIAVRCDSPTF